jgi:hypothetical protein
MRKHDPSEAGKPMVIWQEDILLFFLGITKLCLALLPPGILYLVSWKISKVAFYVLIGLGIPLAWGSLVAMGYLIKRFVVKT